MKNTFRILIIILSVALMLTACKGNEAEVSDKPSASATPAPAVMPVLPDLDFEGMEFMEDGYEIVQFVGQSDGDTANFVLKEGMRATRFLAIDTPETNSSTGGLHPYALPAKDYTKEKLEKAKVIILEKDDQSDIEDNYGRLLAWVWVDGELLNYKLVEEGLAWVKYLYGDYKYNNQMIKVESEAQKKDVGLWSPDTTYEVEDETQKVTLAEARKLPIGSSVEVTGVVTSRIGSNAYIQDETGAIYIYANSYNYSALYPGIRVTFTARTMDYNGLLELSNVLDKKITAVEEGIAIEPMVIELAEVGEETEAMYVRIDNLTVTSIDASENTLGYSVHVKSGDSKGIIRIDKYMKPYIEPDFFTVGEELSVIGNIGQYQSDYQIMISGEDDILR
ncbi:MAG TPA: thermonuclease family protein [Clostridia bacterium]|nr:thermonuclease family protein [Clostridia bacterium]HRX42137.1 thermonuclease family protein [Clostridia bacterium]